MCSIYLGFFDFFLIRQSLLPIVRVLALGKRYLFSLRNEVNHSVFLFDTRFKTTHLFFLIMSGYGRDSGGGDSNNDYYSGRGGSGSRNNSDYNSRGSGGKTTSVVSCMSVFELQKLTIYTG
jgi:hypothetical protein